MGNLPRIAQGSIALDTIGCRLSQHPGRMDKDFDIAIEEVRILSNLTSFPNQISILQRQNADPGTNPAGTEEPNSMMKFISIVGQDGHKAKV
ncbi:MULTISPECIES: hypothetical protein [unclassified Mesorhizobium]|uniref:hypothetical protein n=1 Tax=unclassified Mesorhizobium TaxID=325217 RepID=UPI00109374C3|nr:MULTISPECIES: hypothetical protein [unclassified Mesorhizobium]TGS46248.1 hypothetical protein EN825_11595 [Mesorhizobium sp. M8A.F.Ca.ET.182.01.1.1]TGS81706.1 hypothetical protein EN824_11825 [Mesorhizobium sp. M8A.F.Ca.ET.181.01.1.1]